MTVHFNYITDADAIYKKSFESVRSDIDLSQFPTHMHDVIIRMVHACATPEIVPHIAYTPSAVQSIQNALYQDAHILCDSQMVVSGIHKRICKNPIICTLNDDKTPLIAKQKNTTRSAGAIELWKPYIKGAIVIIGNAPTALFYLLERIINDGWEKPACIIGMPIGYVGASESKDALINHADGIDYITLTGKQGGSAIACATINAILGCNQEVYNDIS